MAIILEEKDFINLYSLTPEQNAAYINLFIVGLGSISSGVIGLFFLRNINAINLIIEKLREKNNNLKFVVYDLDYVIESLKDCEIENIELMSIKEKRLEELGKFDHIIMNPPYSGSLHLKILREAMKHSDDIVNLSPIRWLQDPLAEYKKTSDWNRFEDIRTNCSSLDIISSNEVCKLFNITWGELGIYHIQPNGGNISPQHHCPKFAIEKIAFHKGPKLSEHALHSPSGKHVIRVPSVYNPSGGNPRNQIMTTDISKALDNFDVKTNVRFFSFEDKDCAVNFFNTLDLKIMRYIKGVISSVYITPFNIMPYLDDYSHPWTDQMLYDYFGLTDDEIKTIEKEI